MTDRPDTSHAVWNHAWEPWTVALSSPGARFRVKLASLILGKRLFNLQRDVWKAVGERDMWLATVRESTGKETDG
jgi:hypothetical protein